MLEVLYYVFIFPLEGALEWILSFFADTFGFGVATILLSICVNIFLLKVVTYFQKKAEKIYTLQKECQSKISEFKRVFSGAELHSYIRTLYKQKHFHHIYTLQGLGALALQIPFFIAIIALTKHTTIFDGVAFLWIDDLSKSDRLESLFGLHILPILMSIFTLINVYLSSKDKWQRLQGIFITIIFLVLLYDSPSVLVLYWSANMLFALLRTLERNRLKVPKIISKILFKQRDYAIYRDICIFAILNICFMICIFSPFAAYSSDTSQFDISHTYSILGGLFGVFLFASLFFIYTTSFFYQTRIFKIGVFALSVALLMGLLYSFILTGDYGAMDRFVFQKLSFADRSLRLQKYIYAISSFFVASIFVGLLLWRKISILKAAFRLIFLTQIIVSSMYLIKIVSFGDEMPSKDMLSDTIAYEKDSIGSLLSYARSEKNIVVFVLDMFSGSHIHYILDQFPDLKQSLDGFVIFDNATTTTNSTIHSISTLIGGEYYTAYNMNERGDNLADSIYDAYGSMAQNFLNAGYAVDFALSALPRAGDISPILKRTNNEANIIARHPLFNAYYLQSQRILYNLKSSRKDSIENDILKFVAFGLFKFSPELYFRPKIYNNGFWLDRIVYRFRYRSIKDSVAKNTPESIGYSSSFYGFTHLNTIDSSKPTFKFLHSLMTHLPYGMYYHDNKCQFFSSQSALDNISVDINYPSDTDKLAYHQHYDTESCALSYLSDYIKWLKDNDIYDNTQIFVVSDHGGNDPIGLDKSKSRFDALFMFKDFKSKGEVRFDSRLMVNYDIVPIFCENIGGCANVAPNILRAYPKVRSVISTIPTSWRLEDHKQNQWILDKVFSVSVDIYDPANWQDITKK